MSPLIDNLVRYFPWWYHGEWQLKNVSIYQQVSNWPDQRQMLILREVIVFKGTPWSLIGQLLFLCLGEQWWGPTIWMRLFPLKRGSSILWRRETAFCLYKIVCQFNVYIDNTQDNICRKQMPNKILWPCQCNKLLASSWFIWCLVGIYFDRTYSIKSCWLSLAVWVIQTLQHSPYNCCIFYLKTKQNKPLSTGHYKISK